jgi:hypothetical protein
MLSGLPKYEVTNLLSELEHHAKERITLRIWHTNLAPVCCNFTYTDLYNTKDNTMRWNNRPNEDQECSEKYPSAL